jgi:hypothetical protein
VPFVGLWAVCHFNPCHAHFTSVPGGGSLGDMFDPIRPGIVLGPKHRYDWEVGLEHRPLKGVICDIDWPADHNLVLS